MANIFKTIDSYFKEKRELSAINFFLEAENHTTISKHKILNIRKAIQDRLIQSTTYSETFECASLVIVHITDENLAHELYKWRNSYYSDNLGLKFVQLKNEDKIVYIAHEIVYSYRYSHAKYIDIFNLIYSFERNALDTKSQMNINYADLFKYWKENFTWSYSSGQRRIISIFSYLTLEEQKFDKLTIKQIANNILKAVEHDILDMEVLKNNISKSREDFYVWLKHGIYMERDSGFTVPFPEVMFINILRFALNENCFTSYSEFFDLLNKDFQSASGIIIDEEIFQNSVNSIKGAAFVKIPNPECLSYVSSLLDDCSEELFKHCHTVYSLQTEEMYLVCDERNSISQSIQTLIESKASNSLMVAELIHAVIETFPNLSENCEQIRFVSGINLLECISYDIANREITITNIQNLSFDNNSFEFVTAPKIIMQLVKYFVDCKAINVDDIYKCEFMNIIPPKFAKQLILYLKTGVYDTVGLDKQLDKFLPSYFATSVQFVENVCEDTDTLRKITFFKNLPKCDIVTRVLNEKEACVANFKGMYGEYDSLDSLKALVDKRENVYLSETNLSDIFTEQLDYYIYPTKVIISKDIYNYNLYKIIGIEWSNEKVYNLSKFITRMRVDAKHIYQIICNMLVMAGNHGFYLATNSTNVLSHLYVDDNLNVYAEALYHFRNSSPVKYERYYSSLLKMFKSAVSFSIPQFSYSDLTRKTHARQNELSSFKYNVQNMEVCKKHGLWRLKHVLCEECQKVYASSEQYGPYILTYKDKLSTVFKEDPSNDSIIGNENVNDSSFRTNVEIGISNNLYENLSPLYPDKIILKHTPDGITDTMCGILYNDFDFEGVINIDDLKNVQRVKVALILVKKLLPHILDGTFVCRLPKVYETMFMHKYYKGEIIIPNIAYIESNVIVSNDKKLKDAKKKLTLDTFYNFLYNYIMADSYYKSHASEIVQILQCIRQHNLTESVLRNYIDSLNMHCEVHKVPFASSHKICPICIENGINKLLIFPKSHFNALTQSENCMFEGGEANLYSGDDDTVKKLFKDKVNLQLKSKVIGKALEKEKLFEEFNRTHGDIKFVCIKNVLFSRDDNRLKLEGYTEELIEDSYKIACLKDKEFVKTNNIQKKDIVDILIKVCIGIQFLHSINSFIGDLNGGNIVIKNNVVYFIDIDGMSMDDAKNGTYTWLYIYPPSADNKCISKDDDWYSLAVQAFYYLTCSHPFKGIANNKNVPQDEIERMRKGMSVLGNHGIRPPSISEGWDFLPQDLIDYFKDTFENGKRESMLELLMQYKESLEPAQKVAKRNLTFSEIERKRTPKIALSPDMYIDSNNNLIYMEQEILSEVVLIETYDNGAVYASHGRTYVVDYEGNLYRYDKSYDDFHIFDIYDGQIFYTSKSDLDYGLKLLVDSLENGKIVTRRIDKVNPSHETANCRVLEQGKIFTMNRSQDEYIVYYNNVELCRCPLQIIAPNYDIDILFDYTSKNALVLLGKEGKNNKYMVITPTMKATSYEAPLEVTKSERCIYGGVLYVASGGKILRYKVDGTPLPSIECDVVRCDSKITRKDNYFFISNPDGSSYMYTSS